ncbi:hypothetical protein EV121DRAFT_214760, partial [Schizophyllum commune]
LFATVQAPYQRTAGNNGKHAAVSSVENIASVSYAVLQVFTLARDKETFTGVIPRTSLLTTKAYLLLPSFRVLYVVRGPSRISKDGFALTLSEDDLNRFTQLHVSASKLELACARFRQRKEPQIE